MGKKTYCLLLGATIATETAFPRLKTQVPAARKSVTRVGTTLIAWFSDSPTKTWATPCAPMKIPIPLMKTIATEIASLRFKTQVSTARTSVICAGTTQIVCLKASHPPRTATTEGAQMKVPIPFMKTHPTEKTIATEIASLRFKTQVSTVRTSVICAGTTQIVCLKASHPPRTATTEGAQMK